MAYRATLIGARLALEPNEDGGLSVLVALPTNATREEAQHESTQV
jgi:hypothetical protein